MTDKLVVFVACEDKKEAEEIAAKIVSEHLAACVNVISGVQSCYIWEGKLTWSKEVLLLVKTSRERFRELETRL
jgi:periplasmic divalent cation tolerance protein